jgi:hypothetical protein
MQNLKFRSHGAMFGADGGSNSVPFHNMTTPAGGFVNFLLLGTSSPNQSTM